MEMIASKLKRPLTLLSLSALLVGGLSACDDLQRKATAVYMEFNQNLTEEDAPQVFEEQGQQYSVQAVVDGLEFPWDFVFVSETEILLTEKPGRLNRINLHTGERTEIAGTPEVVYRGQGGLMGVVLAPDFQRSQTLYLSYSKKVADGYTTALMKARLSGDKLLDQELIFTAEPALQGKGHYGAAMVFDNDGYLFLSVGERQQRQYAQKLDNHLGKILRFDKNGKVPANNPFVGNNSAKPEIYSYGHRNPQGLAIHPVTGDLWDSEHGPQGGDEVNIIKAGANYGWPVITYGEEYGGGEIGPTKQEGMEQPEYYYVPSIATAGISFYQGELFPAWKNSLFVTALRGLHLNRIDFSTTGQDPSENRMLEPVKMRLRAVKESPSGELFVLSENGSLLRLSPQ